MAIPLYTKFGGLTEVSSKEKCSVALLENRARVDKK